MTKPDDVNGGQWIIYVGLACTLMYSRAMSLLTNCLVSNQHFKLGYLDVCGLKSALSHNYGHGLGSLASTDKKIPSASLAIVRVTHYSSLLSLSSSCNSEFLCALDHCKFTQILSTLDLTND